MTGRDGDAGEHGAEAPNSWRAGLPVQVEALARPTGWIGWRGEGEILRYAQDDKRGKAVRCGQWELREWDETRRGPVRQECGGVAPRLRSG
jgi:hypothetical protein